MTIKAANILTRFRLNICIYYAMVYKMPQVAHKTADLVVLRSVFHNKVPTLCTYFIFHSLMSFFSLRLHFDSLPKLYIRPKYYVIISK